MGQRRYENTLNARLMRTPLSTHNKRTLPAINTTRKFLLFPFKVLLF